jgi:hypothetical protein
VILAVSRQPLSIACLAAHVAKYQCLAMSKELRDPQEKHTDQDYSDYRHVSPDGEEVPIK